FGSSGPAVARAIVAEGDLRRCVALAEEFIRPRLPIMPEPIAMLRDLVERLASDASVIRVEQAAAIARVDLRTLQRRFRDSVGVSPKWVIRRYRLLEAAEHLATGASRDMAALARRLGYFDQSHFIRDFKAVVGRSPGDFARESRAGAHEKRD